MYDKEKFLQGLNATLKSIPNNISQEGKAKKEKIKVNLKTIEDKNNQAVKCKNKGPIKKEEIELG